MGLPPIHDWFTSQALFLLLSYAVTAVIALIGVKAMISKRWVYIFGGVGAIVALIGWYSAADQARTDEAKDARIAAQDSRLTKISLALDRIAAGRGVPVNQPPEQVASAVLRQFAEDADGSLKKL